MSIPITTTDDRVELLARCVVAYFLLWQAYKVPREIMVLFILSAVAFVLHNADDAPVKMFAMSLVTLVCYYHAIVHLYHVGSRILCLCVVAVFMLACVV